VEMTRRFLLVGLYVAIDEPFHQGSVMQVGLATLTAMILLTLQLQSAPYRHSHDNLLALVCSLSLASMLLMCIFYKYANFTELPDIHDRMSLELKNDYDVVALVISAIFIASVFAAIFFATFIFLIHMAEERSRKHRDARAAQARRLRSAADGIEIELGECVLPGKKPTDFAPTYEMGTVTRTFHLFLSHVWGTGQDQMRIVKQRVLEMREQM
jgi:hypothetical protein